MKASQKLANRATCAQSLLQTPLNPSRDWKSKCDSTMEWNADAILHDIQAFKKQKTPSESITWGHVLAEEAGFEPAVGY